MSLSKADKEARDRYLEKLRLIRESGHLVIGETQADKLARIERAKVDYNYFVRTYFPHYAESDCAKFHVTAANKVKKNKLYRGVWEWARGLAKSTHATIFIPIWLWIQNDLNTAVVISVNSKAANTLLSDLQAEFEANPQLIRDFGEQKVQGDWEEGNFRTKNGCAFHARGRGEKLRGLRNRANRPDYVVMDDLDDDEACRNPRRVREYVQWVMKAVMGISGMGTFRTIIVNNRIAPITIMGHFADHPKWHHIKVNALDKTGKPSWPEHYTLAWYKEKEESTTMQSFQTEYMNNPMVEGDVYKASMIQHGKCPPLKSFDHIVGYWDIAFTGNATSDFNAVVLMGVIGRNYWTIDCYVRQSAMSGAINFIYEKDAEIKKAGVHCMWYAERQFWNAPVEDAMREMSQRMKVEVPIIRDDRQKGNKLDRLISMSFYWQQMRHFYNEAGKATYDQQTLIAQTLAIEPGMKSNDDGPDAQGGAIDKLVIRTKINDRMPMMGERKRPIAYG